jgi:hypothetical protein
LAKYDIKFDDSQVSVLNKIALTLDGYDDKLRSIATAMDTRDSLMATLRSQVSAQAKAIPPLAERVRGESNVWSGAVVEYKGAEARNVQSLSQINIAGAVVTAAIGTVAASAGVGATGAAANASASAAVGAAVVGNAKPVTQKKAKASWFSKAKNAVKGAIKTVGKIADDGLKTAAKAVTNAASAIKKELSPGGVLYRPFKIVQSSVNVVAGATMVAAGFASAVVTGGMSTPIAAMAMAYGANSMWNAFRDIGVVAVAETDEQIEREYGSVNLLKDGIKSAAGSIGEAIGGESGRKVGEFIGSAVYTAGDVVSKFATVSYYKDIENFEVGLSKVTDQFIVVSNAKTIGIVSNVAKTIGDIGKQLEYFAKGEWKESAIGYALDKIFDGKELVDKFGKKIAEEVVENLQDTIQHSFPASAEPIPQY